MKTSRRGMMVGGRFCKAVGSALLTLMVESKLRDITCRHVCVGGVRGAQVWAEREQLRACATP